VSGVIEPTRFLTVAFGVPIDIGLLPQRLAAPTASC